MPKSIVSSTIYVGRPDLIDLDNEVDYEEIEAALSSASKTATEITILGGFYSLAQMIAMFEQISVKRRRICRVRVAVGLESAALIPRTWSDMARLRERLVQLRFPNPQIAIVDSAPVHFHTKLFRFLNTTRPVWFVGSANPGSGRHELLVRIPGKHKALSGYVEAVFAKAIDVRRPVPPPSIQTLRDFFLSGMLCHKPPVQRLFTFDAFHFDAAHRTVLSLALAGTSGVDHASPKAQGFGFDLRSALGLTADNEAEDAIKAQFRPYSVDTVFGWWMPRAYAHDIQRDVSAAEQIREGKLKLVGDALRSSSGPARAREALATHVASMQTFLAEHSIDARPLANREARFDKFLASRTHTLTDEVALHRLARSLTMTDMPDIWADGSAVSDFQESFFEDLAHRAAGNTQPRAVKAIIEWLDDDTLSSPQDLEHAMIEGLADEPWTNDCW